MVNANTLADLLGGIVFWDPRTKTLTLAAGGKRFRFVQGSRSMDVDGQQTVLPLPMESDRRVPLKSVVAVLRGTVQVDLASFDGAPNWQATLYLWRDVASGELRLRCEPGTTFPTVTWPPRTLEPFAVVGTHIAGVSIALQPSGSLPPTSIAIAIHEQSRTSLHRSPTTFFNETS